MLHSFSSNNSEDTGFSGMTGRMTMNDEETEEFETLVQLYLRDAHYTSVTQATLNLSYSMINVALVGLPFVAYEAGIPIFIIVVVGFATISVYTTCILIEMSEDKRVRSLEDLGEKAFGPRGYFTTCIMQILFSLLLICITLDVWGDIVPELMRRLIGGGLEEGSFLHFALTNRRSVTILGALLMLPGCFSRSLSRLSWSSFMTVCAITVAVIFVLISFFHHTDCISCSSYQSVMMPRPLWWAVQGVVCFCFTFQRKLFFVYSCLRRRSPSRFFPSVVISHVFVCVMYLFFGVIGALNATTTDDGDDDGERPISYNFFADFDSALGSRIIFDVTRAIVAMSLLCTIPMDCLVAVTKWRRFRRRYNKYKKSLEWGEQDTLGTPSTSPFRPPRNWARARRGSKDSDDMEQRESLLSNAGAQQPVSGMLGDVDADDSEEKGGMCVEMMRLGGCLPQKTRTSDSDHPPDRTPPRNHAATHESKPSQVSVSSTVASSLASSRPSSSLMYNSQYVDSSLHPPSSPPKKSSVMGAGNIGEASGVVVSSEALAPHEEECCGTSDTSHTSSQAHLTVGAGKASQTGSSSSSRVSFRDDVKGDGGSHFSHSEHACNDVHPNSFMEEFADERGSIRSSNAATIAWEKRHAYRNVHNRDTDDLSYNEEWMNQQMQMQSEVDDTRFQSSITDMSDETWTAQERQSSVGQMAVTPLSPKQQIKHMIHVICVWTLTLGVSLIEGNWIIWAAAMGCIVTSAFTFLLPSMLYFRLGVKSDFQSIPIFGYILPNRLCMYAIQMLGIMCILGNIAAGIHFFLKHKVQYNFNN